MALFFMRFLIFPMLSTRSKRAALKNPKYKHKGRFLSYYPRPHLMERLTRELNMSESQVMEQLNREIQWHKDRGLWG